MLHNQLGATQVEVSEMKEAIYRPEAAAGPSITSHEAAAGIAMARGTMLDADQAGEMLRCALATKDYDNIESAVELAEKLNIRIPQLDAARSFLKVLEAAPLPAIVALGTMSQILDIARGSRFRFQKFNGLRSPERFARGGEMPDSIRKMLQDGMLTYTKEIIPRSLLDLVSVLSKQAVSCHKCLLGFCGDRKTIYPAAAGHHVLMTGAQSRELRDEIFLQLCKHLTGNPDARSTLRSWILTCLCVDMFPASCRFELYLLNFLQSASADRAYGEYARYCLSRMEEALDMEEDALESLVLERGLPSVEFIWHVLSGQSNPFRCSQMVAHRRPWQDSRAGAA